MFRGFNALKGKTYEGEEKVQEGEKKTYTQLKLLLLLLLLLLQPHKHYNNHTTITGPIIFGRETNDQQERMDIVHGMGNLENL